jgi:hypothetical protein
MNHLFSKIIKFSSFFIFALFIFYSFLLPTTFAIGNVVSNPLSIITSGSEGSGGGGGSGSYQPITPGYQNFFRGATTFEKMLERIFEVSVYFTVILAVIMIIVGGVEYMGSESVFKKGQGKERILAAISGLLIALISILIISTLLPGGTGTVFEINIFGN